jgi:hypothetical protein
VKDYILALVHDTLLTYLPWNSFYPRDEDLRLMVSVIDSFLPLCHEFLGRVFVEIPWSDLFRRNPYAMPRAISPLLHIAVKLAAEPQVRLVNFIRKLKFLINYFVAGILYYFNLPTLLKVFKSFQTFLLFFQKKFLERPAALSSP